MGKILIESLFGALRQRAVLVSVVLLAVSALGLRVLAERLEWYFQKEAIPLRASLEELGAGGMGPYVVIRKSKIEDPDVAASLGTEDYIQWILEDTGAGVEDSVRHLVLFVTYYTGNPDKVPHIPERCYVGGGGSIEGEQDVKLKVPGGDGEMKEIPLRVLEMEVPGGVTGRYKQIVTYFFSVNGRYATSRNAVRMRLNLPTERYAYFSKVEVTFPGDRPPSREDAIAAVERLCSVVVPLLEEEHWPDWEALP